MVEEGMDEDLAHALALSMQEVTAADLASQQQQQQAGDTGADTGEASGGSNSNGQSRKRVHDGSDAGADASKTPRGSEVQDVAGGATASSAPPVSSGAASHDDLLEQALALSLQTQGSAGAAAPAAVPAAGAAVSSGAATASPPAGAAGPATAQPAAAASAAPAQPAEAADAPAGQQGPDSSSLLDQLLAAQQAALASGHGVALLQQMGLDEATAQALALSMQPQPFDPADDAADQMDDDYAGGDMEASEAEGSSALDGETGEDDQPGIALEDLQVVASALSYLPLPPPPPPAWLDRMRHWLPEDPARFVEPVELPDGAQAAVQAALTAAMGITVHMFELGTKWPADINMKDPQTVSLPLVKSNKGATGIVPQMLNGTVKYRVAKFRLRKERLSELGALAAVHGRAAAQLAATGDAAPTAVVRAALEALQTAVARRALRSLAAEDPEDLYYMEGESASELLSALASERVRQPFLALMLVCSTQTHESMWEQVLQTNIKQLADFDFTKTDRLDSTLFTLDLLTRAPLLQQALVSGLLREAEAAGAFTGGNFEKMSFMAPLLQVGSVPDAESVLRGRLKSPARSLFEALRGYPGNRGEADGAVSFIRRTLERVQAAQREIAMRVIKAKGTALPRAGQEAVLAWLAAVAGANTPRVMGGEVQGVVGIKPLVHGSSDRFALGAASIGLQLCRPFLAGEAKHMAFLQPEYLQTELHRFGNFGAQAQVPPLAAAPDAAAARSAADAAAVTSPAGPPGAAPAEAAQQDPAATSDEAPGSTAAAAAETIYLAPQLGAGAPPGPHFVAECFFITGQLMSTGVIPAANRYVQLMDALRRGERGKDVDAEGGAHGMGRAAWLLHDATTAQLLQDGFASDAVQYAVLQVRWLERLINGPGAQAALALVPESLPKDAASWLTFCVQCGRADLVSASDVGGLVGGITAVLECRHIASPLVADKMVTLLTAMLKADQRRAGPLVSAASSRALRLAVLGTGAAQQHLLPALMRVYAMADAVVGLDVDRDSFDKFSMRHHIDELLLDIWRDPAQKKALTRLAAEAASVSKPSGAQDQQPDDLPAKGGGALLVDYARAMLNSLMYMLGDSLERFYDVHNIEQNQADEAAWAALPASERETKLRFRESQRGLGGSYMRTAVTTLQLLLELVSDEQVAATFLAPPLIGLAAFSSLHFLELLVGPKAAGLSINDPEKLGFDPVKLSVAVSEFMLHLARRPVFVTAIAEEPDYNEAILKDFYDKVSAGALGAHGHAVGLEQLMQQVAQIRGKEAAAAGGPAAGADEALQLDFAQPEPENLDEAYQAALGEVQTGDFDSTAPRAYSSLYSELAATNAGDTAAKMRKLGKELKALSGRTRLPMNAAAAIYLRYDSDRIDKMRAIITGPEDTPYEGGLFVFDLFFPAQYPHLPPSMKLETTGQGKARFNPNLYADGKVCLSLLGTFSSSDASERWNPATSSLFQVLLSIQGMILIGDPYFNEPSVEQMRSTAQGASTSAEYNFGVQLNTMRWAMIDQLRHPPPGFEEVVSQHFKLLRWRIMRTAAKWLQAAQALPAIDDVSVGRMRATITELHGLLAAL